MCRRATGSSIGISPTDPSTSRWAPGGILVTPGCKWVGATIQPDGTAIGVGFAESLPGVSDLSVFVVGRYLLGPA
jgi:hypothetical protein